MTFGHTLQTANEDDMLIFLRGGLQIYLEYWNFTSSTPMEYSQTLLQHPSNVNT